MSRKMSHAQGSVCALAFAKGPSAYEMLNHAPAGARAFRPPREEIYVLRHSSRGAEDSRKRKRRESRRPKDTRFYCDTFHILRAVMLRRFHGQMQEE